MTNRYQESVRLNREEFAERREANIRRLWRSQLITGKGQFDAADAARALKMDNAQASLLLRSLWDANKLMLVKSEGGETGGKKNIYSVKPIGALGRKWVGQWVHRELNYQPRWY